MSSKAFARAVAEWKQIVGDGNVRIERGEVERAATATYAVSHRVLGIVRPRTRDEVRACVRVASTHRTPIYPISQGKNWGYGSRVPAADGAVILDLSRMRRIVKLDLERGSVTVQPGVTVAELFAHLQKRAPGWAASLPGATTTQASVVGNALDGGLVHGPHGDRFAHVYSLEVVLATGEVFHTGLDRLPGGAKLGGTEARVGPSLRELFVQSNLGIVTEMTIGLFPLPNDLRRVRVSVPDVDAIGPLLDKVRQLKLERVLPDPVGLFNDYERISVGVPYPWASTYGRTPLPMPLLARLRAALGISPWSMVTELSSADRSIGDAREQVLRRALEGYDVSVRAITTHRAMYFSPAAEGLFGLYWRKRGGAVEDADPHRDRCGLIWCDFLAATDGPLLARAVRHVEPLVRSYGFEPAIELHAMWPRATYIVVSIAYDREVQGEDDRVEACDRALTTYFAGLDILPARRRVGSMDLLPVPVDDSAAVLARLKAAFDPEHVLSPGRYDGTAKPPPRVAQLEAAHTAFAQIERAHRDVIDRRATSAALGPQRPVFVERERYELVHTTTAKLLTALRAVATRIAASPRWREYLGVEEDVARALDERLATSPLLGLCTGVFDERGRYAALGFESSLVGVAESAAVAKPVSATAWRAPLRRPKIGNAVVLVDPDGSSRHTLALQKLVSRAAIVTPESLGRTRSTVYAHEWRTLLARPAVRQAVLGGLRTNAPGDILLANLAGFALLHEDAAAGRLDRATQSLVDDHVPWTALLENRRLELRGKRIDLLDHVVENKESLVLRPLHRCAAATWIGEFVTRTDWKKLVKAAVRDTANRRPSWVVQERIRIAHEVFPLRREGGALEFEGCFIGIDALVLASRLQPGLVARVAERPRVGPGCDETYPVAAFVGPKPPPKRSRTRIPTA